MRPRAILPLALCLFALPAFSEKKITSPKEALGFNIGDDYQVANYTQLETYWKKLAGESDRMKLVDIGKTAEGRSQYMAVITSPENQKHLARYKDIAKRLALAQGITEAQARTLSHDGKAVIWIDGGLHATETVGSQQLIETVYQLVSRTDPETMRILSDDIVLCVLANPDGQELVANWYMREKDPLKRSMADLPRLYQKYIGHDDNRDFFLSSQVETTNMNRQMFLEWFPRVVYNHHQTGPAGAVIFIPPFRDPFNYNFDPLVPLGVEMVGTAMHTRLVAQGLGGSAMRSGSSYSTWWNGGLRTVSYFHNMIGILTEIIGSPTPIDISLVADKQLPSGDWPLPIAPGPWHYRQSIDYEISNNYAILDLASKNRETMLYQSWRMGMNSIERGSKDTWTITPKRIEALRAAGSRPAGRGGAEAPAPTGDTPGAGGGGRGGMPFALYQSILHDPKYRDPRVYIIPANQTDFATATKFVNTLLKNGVTVLKAPAAFSANGKTYPAGSYVIKTAQAFRPHVLDMFEAQDHPNDFGYPGGPPIPPYDITGWTLAMQMAVEFDRLYDDLPGTFTRVQGLLDPPAAAVTGPANPAGWLLSHKQNDSFIVINRLLKANAAVYWLRNAAIADGQDLGTGTIWVPVSPAAKATILAGAKSLGVGAHGVTAVPAGEALKLKPIRIGLYDQYGGLMPSGWTRWIFEQYEFPFQVVYPQTLDAGDLRSKFDVLVFTDGAARLANTGGRGRGGAGAPEPANLPAEYKNMLGRITADKTMPKIKQFVESGGTVLTIGSSTSMAEILGIPVKNALTEAGPDGRERNLPQEKFYIPGSLLKTSIDNTNPLAYGMGTTAEVFFDSSPTFKLGTDAAAKKTFRVAWYNGPEVLDSGWAWGQQYLNGGTAIAEASVGEGKVVLLGPEVAFRAQPHGTFKLLFNGLYYGSATAIDLK
ncbi:MAG: peptidase carboxypeptidase [Bryobacterales bacterium]|nr:peptidase carboxypeptidase [Bryobacterales bacterium]